MLNVYQLEQEINEEMASAPIPGLALAIVKDQEVLYARGFGVTSVEDGGLSVTPQTLFRIGSTTKPLTGTAAMRLVEQGKLDLDRPVKDYLDWFMPSDPQASKRITTRMLLSHTAGFVTGAEHFGPRDPGRLQEQSRKDIKTLRFVAPPGTLWSYSNPGLCFVGCIIEAVSGQPYAEVMQKLVFDPLHMRRTTFDPTVAMTYPLAQSHTLNDDNTLSVQHRFADNTYHAPAGFALSTVLDLANFAMMQMNQGKFRDTQVLSPQSVAEMQRAQASLYTTTGSAYGLTFGLDSYKGVQTVGHDGGISTFASHFLMVPSANTAVILLRNRMAGDFMKFVNQILDRLLELPEAETPPRVIEPDKTRWTRYVGSYSGTYTALATIDIENEQLTLDFNGQKLPLQAQSNDLYFFQEAEGKPITSVGFVPSEDEATRYVMVNGSACERIERDPAFTPDPASWAALTGVYEGDPLGRWELRLEGDTLFIVMKEGGNEMKLPCTPLRDRCFSCQFGTLEFLMPDDGTGPILEYGRTFRLRRSQE